jgi:flagellum-specific peptidoglycan hydrolase FlgJ
MTLIERAAIVVRIANASVAAELATGCPAEISAAQCVWESGWLQHMPPNSCNCFGIKDTDRFPGAVYVYTTEWMAGKLTPARAAFEVYPTLDACFVDHALLITGGSEMNNLYAPAWGLYCQDHNRDSWFRSISTIYAPGNLAYSELVLATSKSQEIQEAVAIARRRTLQRNAN